MISLKLTRIMGGSLASIRHASVDVAKQTGAISSGNRIVNAADDVAGMSVSTGLKSRVNSLKIGLVNTSQGISMLQVADAGLENIQDALLRMKAVSVSANSAGITDTERAFLNQEFQQLRTEIDRIASATQFNGMSLIDGTMSDSVAGLSTDDSLAVKPMAELRFSANFTNNRTLVINGVTIRSDTTPPPASVDHFLVGTTIEKSLDNLADLLNNHADPRLSQARYYRSGRSLYIEHLSGGELANNFIINRQSSSARNIFTVGLGDLVHATNQRYSLLGGTKTGLGMNSVQAIGAVGNSLLTPQAQESAFVSINFTTAANIANNQQIRIDNGLNGTLNFVIRTTPVVGNALHIQRGVTLAETLDNAVTTINDYLNRVNQTLDYGIRQLEVRRQGQQLIFTNKNTGNPTDVLQAAITVTETTAGAMPQGTTLVNGANSGVNTSGVINPDFIGTVQGFSATYVSDDVVQASLIVGEHSYHASFATTPLADTYVRFASETGGYFDIQLAAGQGSSVGSQSDADQYSARLDRAFSSLTFEQTRTITDFKATGIFAGTTLQARHDDFSALEFQGAAAEAGISTRSAAISVTLSGETYRSDDYLGAKITGFEKVVLTSMQNPAHTLTFNPGGNSYDLSSDSAAADFADQFAQAFTVNEAVTSGLRFQLGKNSDNFISVELGSTHGDQLFTTTDMNITTQESSAHAQQEIDYALDVVMQQRVNVGSLQSRFNYAAANIQSSMLNQQEALSGLIDTDLPSALTEYVTSQVQQKAGISVLAQVRQLQSSLLGLLER